MKTGPWMLALVLATGCGDDGGEGGEADAAADAPGVACDPERTRVVPGNEPIEEGTFCDEVFACAGDDQPAEIEAAAPGFVCEDDTGFGCSGGERVCRRDGGGGEVSPEDYEQICAITVLADPPAEVVCMIFL
jgi:hypothetical protein